VIEKVFLVTYPHFAKFIALSRARIITNPIRQLYAHTVLIFEQKQGTSHDSPCYKDAPSFKQSYGLSVPVIYLAIRAYNERDLAFGGTALGLLLLGVTA
jgi:hypothetical protein